MPTSTASSLNEESCRQFLIEYQGRRPLIRTNPHASVNLLPTQDDIKSYLCKQLLSATEAPSTTQIDKVVSISNPIINKKDRNGIIKNYFFERNTHPQPNQKLFNKVIKRGAANLLCYNGVKSIFDFRPNTDFNTADKKFLAQQAIIKTEFMTDIEKQLFKKSAHNKGIGFIRDFITEKFFKAISAFCGDIEKYVGFNPSREKRGIEKTIKEIRAYNHDNGITYENLNALPSLSFFKRKAQLSEPVPSNYTASTSLFNNVLQLN